MMKAIYLLAGVALLSVNVNTVSAQNQPIFLTAEQFTSVRFPASLNRMKPQVREQLKGTFPNARSDVEKIDWDRAGFRIVKKGNATLAFDQPRWFRIGTTTMPATSPVAAEAYFNCSSQSEVRKISSSDVRTLEAEETRAHAVVNKDSVKTTVTLTWTPPEVSYGGASFSGGLGGEASKEWQRSVERSDEFTYRTKETIQTSDAVAQDVTIAPLSLRFFEYRVQSVTEIWDVIADAIVDAPVQAAFTRPEYEVKERIRLPMGWATLKRKVPAKDFMFDLGSWSYYLPAADRTVKQRATVKINRQTTILGPTTVQFESASACQAARNSFTQNQTDLAALLKLSQGLGATPAPIN